MRSEQRFHRTIFQVVVLSDEPLPERLELGDIDRVGHSDGVMTKVSDEEVVTHPEAAPLRRSTADRDSPVPMRSDGPRRLPGMASNTQTSTTITNLGVAMFSVADQDAALAFYTEKLGFEVRSDDRFGEDGEHRWLEVAPPGSTARLALNPPMGGQPGGGGIGVETPDVLGEHSRLSAIGGIDIDPEPMRTPGAPLLFMLRDPDGNTIAVVEAPPSA
jgi:catechol 2,3-dioxygenase-like lactoylglutathione lyase family enzyme